MKINMTKKVSTHHYYENDTQDGSGHDEDTSKEENKETNFAGNCRFDREDHRGWDRHDQQIGDEVHDQWRDHVEE